MAHLGSFNPPQMYQDPGNPNGVVQAHAATGYPPSHAATYPTTFQQTQYQHQQHPVPQQHQILPPHQQQPSHFYGHQQPPQKQYYPNQANNQHLYPTSATLGTPSYPNQQQQHLLPSPGPSQTPQGHGQSHSQHISQAGYGRPLTTTAEQMTNGQSAAYAQHQAQDLWGGVGVSDEQRQLQIQYQGREPSYPHYNSQPPRSAPTPNPNMLSSAPSTLAQTPQQRSRTAMPPPQQTPQNQSSAVNAPRSSHSIPSSMSQQASTSNVASNPSTQSAQPVFKTPYPPQNVQNNNTPQRPGQQQQGKPPTPKSSPSTTANPPQPLPNTIATKPTISEKDKARITALFEINTLILNELIKLQEQGLAGPEYKDPKSQNNPQTHNNNNVKNAANPSPPPNHPPNNPNNPNNNPLKQRPPLFADYLHRMQSNLQYLEFYRTLAFRPPTATPIIHPIRPTLIEVGPSSDLASSSEAEEIREAFRNARKLWTDEELAGPSQPPGYAEQERKEKERVRMMQIQQMQMQQQQQQARAVAAAKERGQMLQQQQQGGGVGVNAAATAARMAAMGKVGGGGAGVGGPMSSSSSMMMNGMGGGANDGGMSGSMAGPSSSSSSSVAPVAANNVAGSTHSFAVSAMGNMG